MKYSQVSIRCPNCQRVQFFPFRHEINGAYVWQVLFCLEDTFRFDCRTCGNLVRGQLNPDNVQNLMMLYEITSEPKAAPPPQGASSETDADGRP